MPASSTGSPDYTSKMSLLQGRNYCKHQDKGPSDVGLGLNRGSPNHEHRGKSDYVLKSQFHEQRNILNQILKIFDI